MDDQVMLDRETIDQARRLVLTLEEGDAERAGEILDQLTKIRETTLFQEVGRLTRQLHDTLVGFHIDERLSSYAHQGMPDAKKRLNQVIEMTESAAHKTMAAIEKTIPVCESLQNRSIELNRNWGRFMSRELSVEEFRELARELGTFLTFAEQKSTAIKAGLNEILMAQDYQDLTGQAIKKVIRLVQEVEDSLVDMIRLSGARMTDVPTARQVEHELPSVTGQDEVDDLLSSLGF